MDRDGVTLGRARFASYRDTKVQNVELRYSNDRIDSAARQRVIHVFDLHKLSHPSPCLVSLVSVSVYGTNATPSRPYDRLTIRSPSLRDDPSHPRLRHCTDAK